MNSGYVVLAERGLVSLRGDDARGLLQGVISTDIERVTPAIGELRRPAHTAGQVSVRLRDCADGRCPVAGHRAGARGRPDAPAPDVSVARQGRDRGPQRRARGRSRARRRPRRPARSAGAARRGAAPEGWHRADRSAPCPARRPGGVAARSQRGDARRDRLRGPVACGLRAGAPRARGAGRSRSGGRPLDPLGERLRGAARRRLQEGLLRRPGADGAHEISRPGAQAPDAGRLQRSAAGAWHADPARRQGRRRDALGPGRPRHRAAAPGAGSARGRGAAGRCWPMRPR